MLDYAFKVSSVAAGAGLTLYFLGRQADGVDVSADSIHYDKLANAAGQRANESLQSVSAQTAHTHYVGLESGTRLQEASSVASVQGLVPKKLVNTSHGNVLMNASLKQDSRTELSSAHTGKVGDMVLGSNVNPDTDFMEMALSSETEVADLQMHRKQYPINLTGMKAPLPTYPDEVDNIDVYNNNPATGNNAATSKFFK